MKVSVLVISLFYTLHITQCFTHSTEGVSVRVLKSNLSKRLLDFLVGSDHKRESILSEKRDVPPPTPSVQPEFEGEDIPLPYSDQTSTENVNNNLKKRGSVWPTSVGCSKLRTDHATNRDSCDTVGPVPEQLRDNALMNGFPVHSFYTKYTQVYGIPIIGSSNVTDEGLKRACYTVRMLLASRYDIRNAIYRLYIKVALIGDGEQQTTLPEYNHYDSEFWDTRARGLGPSLAIPMTSAGDDNMRCKGGDRYFNQDILVHEFSHAVDQIGATYAVPGFKKRLYELFDTVVRNNGKWVDTYAASNPHEYFGVASQFYFNSFRYPGTYLTEFGVTDRDTLRVYDPEITDLLDEVHPCVADGNTFVHRCIWNACNSSRFELVYDKTANAKSNCTKIATGSINSVDGCAAKTCSYKGNVFNWKGSKCQVLRCNKTETNSDLRIIQIGKAFNIYRIINEPVMDLSSEFGQVYSSLCTKNTGACEVDSSNRVPCAWPGVKKKKCKRSGCCFDTNTKDCFYPQQGCVDKHYLCSSKATKGDCERNPGFMLRKCQLACGVCHKTDQINQIKDTLEDMCQDRNIYCADWANGGECTKNKSYMNSYCRLSCAKCTPPSYPLV